MNSLVNFSLVFPDGTSFDFRAYVSVSVDGKKPGEALTFTLNLIVNSEIDVVDPADATTASEEEAEPVTEE